MSDRERRIPRGRMSVEERRARSELNKLLSRQGVMRGTLLRRQRVCGKPNCKCARGDKHESLYLVARENGKLRQLYVPKDWEQVVQQWVEHYQQAKELMEEISRLHWAKVRDRQG